MFTFNSFDVSASGMDAQRTRLNLIASNLANVNTTRTANGDPYRRRDVVFGAVAEFFNAMDAALVPVRTLGVIEDQRPFKVVHSPGHPHADAQGFLKMPNINLVEEMVNMIAATRAYDANVAAFNATKGMMAKALELGSI